MSRRDRRKEAAMTRRGQPGMEAKAALERSREILQNLVAKAQRDERTIRALRSLLFVAAHQAGGKLELNSENFDIEGELDLADKESGAWVVECVYEKTIEERKPLDGQSDSDGDGGTPAEDGVGDVAGRIGDSE